MRTSSHSLPFKLLPTEHRVIEPISHPDVALYLTSVALIRYPFVGDGFRQKIQMDFVKRFIDSARATDVDVAFDRGKRRPLRQGGNVKNCKEGTVR
jgi:hypothetical protein